MRRHPRTARADPCRRLLARLPPLALALAACGCAGPAPERAPPPPAPGTDPVPYAWSSGRAPRQDRLPRYVDRPGFGDDEYSYMRIAFEGGMRTYSDDAWGDLDVQPVYGFTGTHEPPDWILGLDAGMYWAGGDDDLAGVPDVDLLTWEGYAGVMKTLSLLPDRLVLELGLGWALTYTYLDEDEDALIFEGDDAWASSGYARASLLLRLGGGTWVGVTGRSLRGGAIDLLGADLDSDYDQLTFTLAARW